MRRATSGFVGDEPLAQFFQVFEVRLGVGPGDLRQRGEGDIAAFQGVANAGDEQPVFNGIEPFRAFRMPAAPWICCTGCVRCSSGAMRAGGRNARG